MFLMTTSLSVRPSTLSQEERAMCGEDMVVQRKVLPRTVSGLPSTSGYSLFQPLTLAMGLSGRTSTPLV